MITLVKTVNKTPAVVLDSASRRTSEHNPVRTGVYANAVVSWWKIMGTEAWFTPLIILGLAQLQQMQFRKNIFATPAVRLGYAG